MQIEKETVNFVASIIHEIDKDTSEELRKTIARRAIIEDKVGDESWLKQIIEKKRPDPELPLFSERDRLVFEKTYGPDATKFLLANLKNPKRISPRWASHFMSVLINCCGGMNEVKKQEDIYGYVTKHPDWALHRAARNIFKQNS